MYFVARTGTGGWSPGYNLTFKKSMGRLTAKVKASRLADEETGRG